MNEVIYGLIDENFVADAVILGDGDCPTQSGYLSGFCNRRNFVLLRRCGQASHISRQPSDAIVGDGDSALFVQEQHRDIIHIFHEQDDNDLTKSTKYCISAAPRPSYILAPPATRRPHRWAICRWWWDICASFLSVPCSSPITAISLPPKAAARSPPSPPAGQHL